MNGHRPSLLGFAMLVQYEDGTRYVIHSTDLLEAVVRFGDRGYVGAGRPIIQEPHEVNIKMDSFFITTETQRLDAILQGDTPIDHFLSQPPKLIEQKEPGNE